MTPDEAVAYHRTFLLFDPSTHLCKVGCHGTKGLGGKVLVDGPTFSPSGRGNPSNGLPHFPHADLKKVDERTDLRRREMEEPNLYERYPATQLILATSKEITVVPKMAQNFRSYATEWEKLWSGLAFQSSRSFFRPILDESLTVIGYIGWISEFSIIVPANFAASGFPLHTDLRDEPTLPVFVEPYNSKGAPEGWRYFRNGRSHYEYLLVTGIDGEVIEVVDRHQTNGEAIPVDSFLDYVSLANVAGSLVGRTAIALARGLGRSLSRVGGRLMAQAAARKFSKRALTLQFVRGHQSAMGIPVKHFDAMAAAAKETDMILMFRANKQAALPWIERGAPGKPFFFKFKSDPETGILTAKAKADVELVYEKGYYIVADNNWAIRVVTINGKKVAEKLPIRNPFWPVKPGQVIDPKLNKPVVGDYDMLGAAPMKSKGSNVAEAPLDPKGNWTGPHVERAAEAVNRRLEQKRVLHGAQDQSLMGLSDDTAYAIFPDGKVVMMYGRKDQDAFFESIGRKSGADSFPQPAGEVFDEVAAMRARRQMKR